MLAFQPKETVQDAPETEKGLRVADAPPRTAKAILESLKSIEAEIREIEERDELLKREAEAKLKLLLIAAHRQHFRVIEAAATVFDVSPFLLKTRTRHEPVAHARQAAMWALRKTTKLSSAQIGAIFQRDHGTVLFAVRAVNDRIATVKGYAAKLDTLVTMLVSGNNGE